MSSLVEINKKCSCCLQVKDLSEFSKNKSNKSGFSSQCKECVKRYQDKYKNERSQYNLSYRKNNQAKVRNYQIKYEKTLKRKIQKWRAGAIRRGILWDISDEYLENIPMICHYTGLELTMEAHKINTISLDRIDSNAGYTSNNVVFCCAEINLMKRKLSIDEFVKICKLVAKFQGENNVK